MTKKTEDKTSQEIELQCLEEMIAKWRRDCQEGVDAEGFESLTSVLEGWFDKPWIDLPEKQQARYERDVLLLKEGDEKFPLWDDISPEQRRYIAELWDYQHDPEIETEREKDFEKYCSLEAKKKEKMEWKLMTPATITEKAEKDRQLNRLQEEIDELESWFDPTKNNTRSRSDGNSLKTKKAYLDVRNKEIQKDSEELELEYIKNEESYTLDKLAKDLFMMEKYKKLNLDQNTFRRLISRKYKA